jgi:hypothetical protein
LKNNENWSYNGKHKTKWSKEHWNKPKRVCVFVCVCFSPPPSLGFCVFLACEPGHTFSFDPCDIMHSSKIPLVPMQLNLGFVLHSSKIPLVPMQLNLGFVLFSIWWRCIHCEHWKKDVALSDVMFLEAVPKVRSYFFLNFFLKMVSN